MVSKTISVGSIPATPAIFYCYGDCGEVVNTADCGSATRGFDPHQSPLRYFYFIILLFSIFMMAIVVKWLTQRIVVPPCVGSIPISRLYIIGLSPSGKATDFDSVMRWFESS